MPDKSYFYAPVSAEAGDSFEVTGQVYNHITRVLRNSVGDHLYIIDGRGHIIYARLEEISKHAVYCSAVQVEATQNELPVRVTLAVGLIKQQRYELMVEKLTELGVQSIQPLITQRVVRKGFRRNRLEKKSIAAMEQSMRAFLPEILDPIDLQELLRNTGQSEVYVAAQAAKDKSLIDLSSKRVYDSIIILIGPEGGWSSAELSLFTEHNLQFFHLGSRRLRTETAAIAAMSQLSLFLE